MQNFRRLVLPLFSIVLVVTVALIMSTYLLNSLNPSFDTHAQNSTDNRKMIGSHTPGYPVFRSTGDILRSYFYSWQLKKCSGRSESIFT